MSGALVGELVALARVIIDELREHGEALAAVREHLDHPREVGSDIGRRLAARRLERIKRGRARASRGAP